MLVGKPAQHRSGLPDLSVEDGHPSPRHSPRLMEVDKLLDQLRSLITLILCTSVEARQNCGIDPECAQASHQADSATVHSALQAQP